MPDTIFILVSYIMTTSGCIDNFLGYAVILIAVCLIVREIWAPSSSVESYANVGSCRFDRSVTGPVGELVAEEKKEDMEVEPAPEQARIVEPMESIPQEIGKMQMDIMFNGLPQPGQPAPQCPDRVCDQGPDENYLNEFARFRSMVNQSSEQLGDDVVDKVNKLYLSENTENVRGHSGVQIKDLFNGLTITPTQRKFKCIGLPESDDNQMAGFDPEEDGFQTV